MSVKLAAQTQKTAGIPNGMRTATVTAVTTGAVTLSINGGSFTAGVGVLTSYAPQVGDVVTVFRQDSSWLILGPASPSNAGQWVRFSSLGYQNGWTDRGSGFPAGQYRIMGGMVYLVGQLSTSAAPAAGQVIVGGLPNPPGEMIVCTATLGPSTTGAPVSLHVDASGNLRIYPVNSSPALVAGLMQFSSLYPLDCVVL